MHRIRLSLVSASVAVVALALWAGARAERTGGHMAVAAERFLGALSHEQAEKATYSFDSPERFDWHFVPRKRNGLAIKEMTSAQRALAFGMVQSGLTAAGYLKTTTIMSLEQVLYDMEHAAGRTNGPTRDPELYSLTIFGKPSNRGKWGWRVEGHHLSLNFVLDDGRIVAATPAFFGSNPGEVRQGPRKGTFVLAEREERALRLLQALDESQKKTAIVSPEAPREVRAANTPQPPTAPAAGIAYADLTGDQKKMLRALVETYALDMTEEVSRAWLGEIRDAGFNAVRFAWLGPAERNQPHAYRVQGPTFVIEFNNTQDNANHIHSLWRNMTGDFGVPLAANAH